MFSRLEKYKKIKRFKMIIIMSGVLVLSIGLGTGMKTALADVDVQQLMANWFSKKQDASIKEIDQAIATERDLLMGQLKEQISTEMQFAEEQLAEFTAAQKQIRIAALQEYANDIKAEMTIDSSEQQAAIMKNIDIIFENAKAQLDGQVAQLKLIPVPLPEVAPLPAPVVIPEKTPAPETPSIPVEEIPPAPDTEVIPIPETETTPVKEGETSTPPVRDEPVVNQPIEEDSNSGTD